MAQLSYMKTELSEEQNEKLCELGIAPTIIKLIEFKFDLQDLLRILPKQIDVVEPNRIGKYSIFILHYEDKYDVGYAHYDGAELFFTRTKKFREVQLIDALFELVVWCVQNGYIK